MLKKPNPLLEVLFEGEGIYPEKIPLGALARALTAVQRLLTGQEVDEEEEGEEGTLRLLDVKRGSAIFRCVGPSAETSLGHLREVGKIVKHPEDAGEKDYILRPIERLSSIARSLDCVIVLREPGKNAVLARIEPSSYETIAKNLLISGDTAIMGEIQRVGGATEMRCALRVPFQSNLLYCSVHSDDIARKLGKHLYEEVAVQGTAQWLKNSWRIISFKIKEVYQLKQGSIIEAFEALREAGGKSWDKIEDPQTFLEEVSGQR